MEARRLQYITYELIWHDNYGYGPEQKALNLGHVIEPSSFAKTNPIFCVLSYAEGIDVENFSEYKMTELSADDALIFAQEIDESAFFDVDKKIKTPTINWLALQGE